MNAVVEIARGVPMYDWQRETYARVTGDGGPKLVWTAVTANKGRGSTRLAMHLESTHRALHLSAGGVFDLDFVPRYYTPTKVVIIDLGDCQGVNMRKFYDVLDRLFYGRKLDGEYAAYETRVAIDRDNRINRGLVEPQSAAGPDKILVLADAEPDAAKMPPAAAWDFFDYRDVVVQR